MRKWEDHWGGRKNLGYRRRWHGFWFTGDATAEIGAGAGDSGFKGALIGAGEAGAGAAEEEEEAAALGAADFNFDTIKSIKYVGLIDAERI